MATRRRTSQRRRASTSVIDLTCDLDSDSDGEVLIVGEAAPPIVAPLQRPEMDIVGMVMDPVPRERPPTPPPALAPSPPPVPVAATDYPRNNTETWLETELSDLTIDIRVMQSHVREVNARAPRPNVERRLRELRETHGMLSAVVAQLAAGRRLRFEGLARPLSAELDELERLLAQRRAAAADAIGTAWQQRDTAGPVRTRRSVYLDDSPPPPPPARPPPRPLPPTLAEMVPDSPPRSEPAASSRSSSPAGASGGLQCPVCWESVVALKEQQCGFLVTRCGHWFCEPCLRSAVRVRRECPICRAKLGSRPPYRPLYL
ncbi:E3 ubiquitin-protein ligase RNF4 [Amphibalanus amphitrite]|uniref:E3 ubiquitin-protein ligase RNF4 n=1 Tax=Amphibalanus amphitrite TaxID=1232801 RepID=A0A6A4X201_AMPAM|nr:WAS/WASL-interacting protein family member 3-like [Amphibalanus amphitrite]XP_043192622.1 WAS/WASL-interacting protein family member 3-like [Amphibalanus amphitrite]XP_043192623.1 WAS/WASL-interacting protein family member 3-like [Amphibalanus amphitrite]XP_043192624.1 WAS/WASL-interacting protein family member 3-like [Amphibalanus amphitrite]XP_043192625.1 WAS/WASL-interacting protein family member 3-like [Amphibalanus amphitrite]XP_043192626.1 WAS/WASL-interacting protein family member 3-